MALACGYQCTRLHGCWNLSDTGSYRGFRQAARTTSNALSDKHSACQADKPCLRAAVTTATGDVITLSSHRLAFATPHRPFRRLGHFFPTPCQSPGFCLTLRRVEEERESWLIQANRNLAYGGAGMSYKNDIKKLTGFCYISSRLAFCFSPAQISQQPCLHCYENSLVDFIQPLQASNILQSDHTRNVTQCYDGFLNLHTCTMKKNQTNPTGLLVKAVNMLE